MYGYECVDAGMDVCTLTRMHAQMHERIYARNVCMHVCVFTELAPFIHKHNTPIFTQYSFGMSGLALDLFFQMLKRLPTGKAPSLFVWFHLDG